MFLKPIEFSKKMTKRLRNINNGVIQIYANNLLEHSEDQFCQAFDLSLRKKYVRLY